MVGWTVLGIVAGLLVLDLLFHLIYAIIVLPVFERKPPFGVEPADPDPSAEDVSFPTTHGLTLRGSLYTQPGRTPRGLILFCPEMGGNHWLAMSYCIGLWNAGFDILSFDFRNQGESDRMPGYEPLHWLTDYEVDDVLAALKYVRSREDLRHLPCGLFGVSRGGGAALAAAARSAEVKCVACDSAFSTQTMLTWYTLRWAVLYLPQWVLNLLPYWHLQLTLRIARWISQIRKGCRYTNLERWLPKLRQKPVFMIAGGRDTYVHPEIARQICRRIGLNCRGPWIIPEAKHNGARRVDPSEYDRRLVEFFSQLSPKPRTAEVKRPTIAES